MFCFANPPEEPLLDKDEKTQLTFWLRTGHREAVGNLFESHISLKESGFELTDVAVQFISNYIGLQKIFFKDIFLTQQGGLILNELEYRRALSEMSTYLDHSVTLLKGDPLFYMDLSDPNYRDRRRSVVGVLSQLSESNLKVIQAFHQTFSQGEQAKTEGAYENLFFEKLTAINQGHLLSTSEKLLLIQVYGRLFLNNYDEKRSQDTTYKPWRVVGEDVSVGQMLTVAYQKQKFGVTQNRHEAAGVCRDIASALGKISQKLGFSDVYVVDYTTIYELSRHATTVMTDIDNANVIHKINYDVLQSSKNLEGALALDQGEEDIALSYGLSKPYGRTIARLASSFYLFNIEAVAGDPSEIDPLADPILNSMGVRLSPEANEDVHLQLTLGQDGIAQYAAVAAALSYAPSDYFPGQTGIALGIRDRLESDADIGYLFFHIDQQAIVPLYQIKKAHEFQWISGFRVDGLTSLNGDAGINIQSEIDVRSGLAYEAQYLGGDLRLEHRAQAHFKPGLENIASLEPAILWDSVMYQSEMSYRVPWFSDFEKKEEEIVFFSKSDLIQNELGLRGRFQSGFEIDHFRLSSYIQGPMIGEFPIYFPASRKRFGSRLMVMVDPWRWYLDGSYSPKIDDFSVASGVEADF